MRSVEVFDEDNCIVIDDQYDTTDFQFFPEEKKFTVKRIVKDDAFYGKQTIEYKISSDPLELSMRTVESSSEPPLEYSIRDGVVMESEVKKNDLMWSSRIQELRKEVEWSRVPIFGNYQVNLFIISKHPEIIPPIDYRQFLRKSFEKISLAVSGVENAVREDAGKLQIHKTESGKSIWYPDSEEQRKESELYWELTKEEREKSLYSKKIKYVEDFKESLFKDDSPKYVGISEYEFRESDELLKYLDNLLNKKSEAKKETEEYEKKDVRKWLSYLWTVLVNLITLGVVVAIYDAILSSFEIIVVSLLILIYLSVQSFTMSYGKITVETAFGLDEEFKRIRKLLKNEPTRDEIDGLKETKKKVGKEMVKTYINAAFIVIIYLITLVNLFGAL